MKKYFAILCCALLAAAACQPNTDDNKGLEWDSLDVNFSAALNGQSWPAGSELGIIATCTRDGKEATLMSENPVACYVVAEAGEKSLLKAATDADKITSLKHASFTLDGVKYVVDANENFDGEPVQCHGGTVGFDKFLWEGEALEEPGRVGVRFHRLSPDGEQGYPGNLDTYVTYWLTDDNTVKIEYDATTDKPTVVNLSNHTYFNLRGPEGCYVMEHLLQVEADTCVQNTTRYCPDLLLPVDDSPFDFREPHRVDYRIDTPNEHLRIMKGMSACWVLRDWDGSLRKAANLYDPKSGRGIETWTTEPTLLTYTGRGFNADKYSNGKHGPIDKFAGMLLETIHFPDSPNQDRFPSTVLRPGESYHSETEFRFYAR